MPIHPTLNYAPGIENNWLRCTLVSVLTNLTNKVYVGYEGGSHLCPTGTCMNMIYIFLTHPSLLLLVLSRTLGNFFFLEWCFQWPLQLIKTTKNQRNLMVGKVMVRIRKKYKLYKNVWWRKEVLPIHRPSMIVKNTWDSFNLVRKKDTKCQERCFTCKLHFQEL